MLTLLSDQPDFTAQPGAMSEPTDVAAGDWTLVVDRSARSVPAGTHPLATLVGTTESLPTTTSEPAATASRARPPTHCPRR